MGLSFFKDIATDLNRRTSLSNSSERIKFPFFKKGDYNDIYSDGNPNKPWNKSMGYGFGVLKENGERINDWKTFNLQLNPQSLQQDEEFSVQFFPTPTGIIVEHQGSIMKDLVISGVTGVHPKRGAGGVNIDGNIIFGTGDSGYKQFHDLRNYIRSYAEHKKDPSNSHLRLAFFNYKDQEFFLVEPVRFSLKRAENRPLMYEYTIVLKTLGRTNGIKEDANSFDNMLGSIGNVLDRVNNAVKVARGVLNGSIALLLSTDRTVRSKVLGPLEEFENALTDFKNGVTTVFGLPKKFLKDLKEQIRDISDKLADSSGVDTAGYNLFTKRETIALIEQGRAPTYEEKKVINTFKNLEQKIELIAFNQDNFTQPFSDSVAQINKSYGVGVTTNVDVVDENGNVEDIAVITGPIDNIIENSNDTVAVQILEDDTLQDIAARLLGDANNFHSLAAVNNLKAPYIVKTEDIDQIAEENNIPDGVSSEEVKKMLGLLTFDDTILIPVSTTKDNSIKNVYSNSGWAITEKLPQVEKTLGVDIKLNKAKDLAITNTNDIALVAGSKNVVQSIGVRLGVDKGSYKTHTQFGINLSIGEKNTSSSLLIRDSIQEQLAQDSRLSPDNKVVVSIQGNVIYVNIYAKIKSVGQTFPLQLVSVS